MNQHDPRYGSGGFGGPGGFGNGGFGNPGQQGGQQGGGSMPPPSAPPPPPPGQAQPQPMAHMPVPIAPPKPSLGVLLLLLSKKALIWILGGIFVLLVAYGILCFFGFAAGAINGFFGATTEMLSRFYRSISHSRIGIGSPGDGVLALGMILIAILGIVKLLRK